MALGPRLDLRQSQSLVMTPQLQQAIKLLALSNLEIEAFIGEALETNPLLEAGEIIARARRDVRRCREDAARRADRRRADRSAARARPTRRSTSIPTALDRDRDTGDWSAAAGVGGGEDGPGIDERGGDEPTLAEHLDAQVGAAARRSRACCSSPAT